MGCISIPVRKCRARAGREGISGRKTALPFWTRKLVNLDTIDTDYVPTEQIARDEVPAHLLDASWARVQGVGDQLTPRPAY